MSNFACCNFPPRKLLRNVSYNDSVQATTNTMQNETNKNQMSIKYHIELSDQKTSDLIENASATDEIKGKEEILNMDIIINEIPPRDKTANQSFIDVEEVGNMKLGDWQDSLENDEIKHKDRIKLSDQKTSDLIENVSVTDEIKEIEEKLNMDIILNEIPPRDKTVNQPSIDVEEVGNTKLGDWQDSLVTDEIKHKDQIELSDQKTSDLIENVSVTYEIKEIEEKLNMDIIINEIPPRDKTANQSSIDVEEVGNMKLGDWPDSLVTDEIKHKDQIELSDQKTSDLIENVSVTDEIKEIEEKLNTNIIVNEIPPRGKSANQSSIWRIGKIF